MITRVTCFFGSQKKRKKGEVGESEEKEEAKCLNSSILLPEDRGNKEWI